MTVSMRMRVSLTIFSCALLLLGAVRSVSAATVSKITIDPATPTTTADTAVTFTITATNTDATTTNISSQTTLSTNDPLGSVKNTVYTPGKVGTWNIQADYQSLQATTTVTVTPGAVKEIVINPNSDPEQAYIGSTVSFAATPYDAKSNVVTGQTITWSVIGENGTVTNKGVFTPTKIGTGKVQAVLGDITGQVSVVANAAIVTNTNTAVTNTSTNAPGGSGSAGNANTNTASIAAVNVNANSDSTTAATNSKCTTLKPWAWSLMLVLFFAVIAVLYALVSITAIWPAIIALAGAAVLAYIQRKYGCGAQAWWPWVITIGTVVLSAAAMQFRPKNTSLPQ